jgi:peroxin-10
VLVALHVVGPYAFEKSLKRFDDENSTLAIITQVLQSISRLHLGWFYIFGSFLHFSKRIISIRYIFNRNMKFDRPSYAMLGALIILSTSLKLFIAIKQHLAHLKFQREHSNSNVSLHSDHLTNLRCILCLEQIVHVAVTSCGHVFCWKCIIDWLHTKPECPVCRQSTTARAVWPMYHYDEA